MSPTNHADDEGGELADRFARLAAASLLATAGGLHLAAFPGHLSESTVAGAFFAVTAAAQLLGAVLVATRPCSRTYRAVMAGNVGVLTLWLMSRTTGLPIGGELGVSEPFGLLDGFAAAAELLFIVAGAAALVRRAAPSSRSPGALRLALVLALTWGLSGGAGLAVAREGHHQSGAHARGSPASGDSSVSSSVTEPGCPAAHDCTDHPH